MKRFIQSLAGVLAMACGVVVAEVSVIDPRCENRVDPLGVDSEVPRFSWKLASGERNEAQRAYQIVVDGVWDSGKVESDRSVLVEYGGPALESRREYRWKVRVWDAKGNPSEYSGPAKFSTGLDSWSAEWIGLDEPEGPEYFGAARWIWFPEGNPASSAPVGSRYFEKEFELGQMPDQATLLITADDGFEVFVNGQSAGTGKKFSDPGRFDVAPLLRAGTNLIRVNAVNAGTSANPAGLIVRLSAMVQGATVEVVTDASWKASRNGTEWTAAHVMGAYGSAPWGTMDAREVPARYVRKEFDTEADKGIVRATAYVCGLGFFDFFLNGEKVSDHVMDPALSNYAKAAYYVTFDVTENMHSGTNAIGVILGNGRFMAPRTRTPAATQTFGFPKLLAQLEIEYADGSKQTVVSDGSWKITDQGPIRSNNEYDGEHYDARMEMPGWNDVGFDESAWKEVERVAAPGGALVSQPIEPVRVVRIIKPVSISSPAAGVYSVDMGEAFYGAMRLKASAPAGTTVRLTSAYSLLPDGRLKTADNRDAKCTDQYIFKGEGVEVWNPRFKGHGFRRAEITGFPGELTVDHFEGLVIHTDVETVGSFECSDPLINDIHASLLRGARMFLRSAPLDPDRDERQAWMGDSSKNAEFEAYNYHVAPFYAKWMDDVARSQRADGSIPDVSMYWDWGQGVEWASVFTIIPDWYIDFYDDDRVAGTHYEAMKRWVLAMRRHEEADGTLRSTSYGDWCDVSTMFKTSDANGATPGNLISSAYQYRNYRIMERLAGREGLTEDEQLFAGLASSLKAAFNARFFNAATNVYQGDTQCAYVLALQFGLVPEGRRQAVIDKLVDNVMLRHKGHLSVGLIGMQWLMQTLTDVGRSDVAWNIVTRTERPGWGYMLSKGATTIWERWDGDTKDGTMNSESLLILAGNLDAWFYQTLGGIRPVSNGFKTFSIRPELLGDLEWVKARFDSPHGEIVSDWTIDSPTSVSLRAVVPPNTGAVVHFPMTKLRNATIREGDVTLWENGEFVAESSAIEFDGADEREVRFRVGSGDYRFNATGSAAPASSKVSVIVDNDDAAAVFAGNWTREGGTEADQRYGFNFAYAAAGNGASTAVFRPELPESGKYRVSALWTSHANRATNSPFTIHHASGETLVTVDQEKNGGVWNVLGTFDFEAGESGYVKLTNAANQYVIADAVKFERVPSGGGEILLEDAFNTSGPGGEVNFEVSSRQSGAIAPVWWNPASQASVGAGALVLEPGSGDAGVALATNLAASSHGKLVVRFQVRVRDAGNEEGAFTLSFAEQPFPGNARAEDAANAMGLVFRTDGSSGAYLSGVGQEDHELPWTGDAASATGLAVELSGEGGTVVHVTNAAGVTLCRYGIPRMSGCYLHFGGRGTAWEIDDLVISNASTGSAYDDWARGFFADETDPGIVGVDADPDGDGVPNLLEFALCGSPLNAGSRGLAQSIPRSSGAEFVLAALRSGEVVPDAGGAVRIEARDEGIMYRVEGSLDLVDWTRPVAHLGVSDHPAGELPDLAASRWTYHIFGLARIEGSEPPAKGFLRARVSNP